MDIVGDHRRESNLHAHATDRYDRGQRSGTAQHHEIDAVPLFNKADCTVENSQPSSVMMGVDRLLRRCFPLFTETGYCDENGI